MNLAKSALVQRIARNSLKRAGYERAQLDSLLMGQTLSTDPVSWIENNFYLYDTSELMSLYEWQRRPLERAFRRDENGDLFYKTVLWSWPKKSAKSSVIAAVADYTAAAHHHASVKLIANDLKQADSRVGYYLRENIQIAQKHGKRQEIKITPSGYKIEYPNGSRVECIPIDPSGEAGGNDDLLVYSELWGWKSKAHQRMWSEMTISPNRFGSAQRWIDSYAGFKGDSPILEQLYETGVTNGRRLWDDLEVYENESARMLSVWVTKPMFPWQTPEYYAAEAANLPPSEFERMHRNQWANPQQAFVPIEWWIACKANYEIQKGEGIIIGVDAGISSDCFAIVAVSRRESEIYVHYVKVWTPTPGGTIDFREPEAELKRLLKEYNIFEISFDAWQLHDMMQHLRNDEYAHVKAFSQGNDRLIADKRLYDLVRDKRIHHHGDPILQEHIGSANCEPEKEKMRLVKRTSGEKIDSAVALSMAAHRAFAYA